MRVIVKTIRDVHDLHELDVVEVIDEVEYFYMFKNIPMRHVWYPRQGIVKIFAFKFQSGDPIPAKTKDDFIQHVLRFDHTFR